MIIKESMAESLLGNAADTKPTNYPHGTKYQEIETAKSYRWDRQGQQWYEQPADGTGAIREDLAQQRRELDLLWKLTHGTIWDTQTDSDPGYAKTVPSGAAAAEIGTIGGKTVRWNQLIQNADFSGGTVNWTKEIDSHVRFTVTDGVATLSTSAGKSDSFMFVQSNSVAATGHVYLLAIRNVGEFPPHFSNYYGGVFSKSGSPAKVVGMYLTSGGWYCGIVTSDKATKLYFGVNLLSGYAAAAQSVSFDRAVAIDLTAMLPVGEIPERRTDPVVDGILAYLQEHPEYDAGSPLSAAVTSIVSRDADAETLDTLEIPAAVRALEGYGQSEIGGDGNVLNLSDGTFTEIGHYVDGVWTALETPVVTDVSALLPDNMLDAEAGGTLTFVQDGGMAFSAPNSVDYLIKLSEVTE